MSKDKASISRSNIFSLWLINQFSFQSCAFYLALPCWGKLLYFWNAQKCSNNKSDRIIKWGGFFFMVNTLRDRRKFVVNEKCRLTRLYIIAFHIYSQQYLLYSTYVKSIYSVLSRGFSNNYFIVGLNESLKLLPCFVSMT